MYSRALIRPPVQSHPAMLFFTYGGMMNPEQLGKFAPKANFQFIAHLPETKLIFPNPDGRPSIEPAPGNTVWGAVFEVSSAVDRSGNKYPVAVFSAPANTEHHPPSKEYMEKVVSGARHWQLPTGWVAGLEDLAEPDL